MKKYNVQATNSSPYINFDPESMSFEIKGASFPDNCWDFYRPMLDWLATYFEGANGAVVEIDMEITRFNSSSAKLFMAFFEMLEDRAGHGKNIVVNWRYHEENESVMECGEEYMEDVERIKFNLVEFTAEEA